MILEITAEMSTKLWVLSATASILIIILGTVLTWIASYLGKKIDKTIEVNQLLIIEIGKINEQIKSMSHSVVVYEISLNKFEDRLRKLELEHAKHCNNCE